MAVASFYKVVEAIVREVLQPPDQSGLQSISGQVAERIKNLIESGELVAGARLVETELAGRFGVSRGPVREGLLLLAREGLVTLYPRRGAYVFQPDATEIRELYEVRAALFGLAAARAAMAMTEEHLALIREGVGLLVRIAKSPDTELHDVMRMRTALGALVLAVASNRRLALEVQRLNLLAVTHSKGFEAIERRVEAAGLWVKICEHFRDRDPVGANEAGMQLVYAGRDALLKS